VAERQDSAIERILEARGVRRDWLANRLGISPSRFTHIEAGRRPPPPGYYERAAAILGVPVEMVRPDEVPA
jgi:transcriptional regulator with XRE-family HTH domain